MAKSRRRLGEIGPKDLRAAAADAYDIECRGGKGGRDGACLQGISYYERIANRKYEGFIKTKQQSSEVVKRALRLCSINRKGDQKFACKAGAFAIHEQVKKRVSEND